MEMDSRDEYITITKKGIDILSYEAIVVNSNILKALSKEKIIVPKYCRRNVKHHVTIKSRIYV